MDWTLAIDRNREALLRLVAALFATAGLARGGSVETLPRQVRWSVLRLLRPLEAAFRRLVVVAARELVARGRTARAAPAHPIPRGTGERIGVFALFDPRKRFAGALSRRFAAVGPRLSIIGYDDPVFEPPKPEPLPDDPVDAARLCRRLLALERALDDVPKQARRLVQMLARRSQALGRPVRALRPGRPPGHRERGRREVDEILSDCHALALLALVPPDPAAS